MADGKVIVTLSVQDAQALAAWQRGKEGIGQMGAELGKVKKVAAEVPTEAERMADSLVSSALKAVTGYVSLRTAIGLVRREYDEMVARQEAAAGFQVSTAHAQRAALRNLSLQELTPAQLQDRLRETQGATGADLGALYQSASGVLSARGKVSESEALDQLTAVARMDASLAADEMQKLAGAALDIRKAFGGTPEQALGALLVSQQTARVEDTVLFAHNAVPALFALQKGGDTYREASALYATVSQESADVEGARSSNAVINFGKQLENATAAIEDLRGKGTVARMEFLTSGAPEAEEIRTKLVGNLDAEADTLDKAHLTSEAKQFRALIGLLTKGSATQKAFEEVRAATPEYEATGERYEQNQQAQRALGLQRAARVAEAGKGAVQTLKQDEREAIRGQVRKDLGEFLAQLGGFGGMLPGGFADRMIETGFFGEMLGPQSEFAIGNQNPILRAIKILDERKRRAEESGEAADPANQAKVQALDEYLDKLRAENARSRHLFPSPTSRKRAVEIPLPPAPAGMRYDATGRLVASGTTRSPTRRSGRGSGLGAYGLGGSTVSQADVDAANARLQTYVAGERERQLREAAEAAAERKKTNELLERVVENTADKKVTVTNAGDADRSARRASSRPPAIGGN